MNKYLVKVAEEQDNTVLKVGVGAGIGAGVASTIHHLSKKPISESLPDNDIDRAAKKVMQKNNQIKEIGRQTRKLGKSFKDAVTFVKNAEQNRFLSKLAEGHDYKPALEQGAVDMVTGGVIGHYGSKLATKYFPGKAGLAIGAAEGAVSASMADHLQRKREEHLAGQQQRPTPAEGS